MTLITLTSPLALRLSDGTTQLSNVFEAETVIPKQPSNIPVGSVRIHIYRVFNSKTQEMITLPAPIRITVKESNVRSRQEVA